MKKLKIAILIDQLVPGGVQKSAINEALELKKLGYRVTLFVLIRLDYSYQYEDLTRDLEVVYLSDHNPWPFRKAWRIPYFSFLTHLHLLNPLFVSRYKILRKFDFIISHGTTTCITAAAVSGKFHIPYLAFIWDPMLYILEKVYGATILKYFFPVIKPLTRHYEQSFLTTAALVATSSKVHQEFIAKHYHTTPLVIYPGCARFQPAVKIKKNLAVLGYTRWELAKNPQIFLDLAQKLPGARFLLAGNWTDEKEEAHFRREIEKRELASRIELFPKVTHQDLAAIASRSLVWIHPNFEAFGMSGLEMAALGLPLVIPQGSGLTEIFEHGKHGYFPQKVTPAGFLPYLKLLTSHPETARVLGQHAAKTAKRFTWKKHAENVMSHIRNYRSRIKVVVLNNAFVSASSGGGGDQFMIELGKRVPQNVSLTVVLPPLGYAHWKNGRAVSPQIRFILLPKTWFDDIDEPVPLFLAYLIRCFMAYRILPRLAPFSALFSATDIISDVIPAFTYKQTHKSIPWISRFFHFIETPWKREGRLWVNIGSYLLQGLSLKLITSATSVMIDNPGLKKRLTDCGIRPEKLDFHPGGVDISVKRRSQIAAFASDALFVGRLQSHKGVFDALDVWRRVVKVLPSARLVFVGYGPRDIIRRMKLQLLKWHLLKNVSFTGYIANRSLLNMYMRNTKLLLFLDHEAGFGLVVVEAMAAGIPVTAYALPVFGNIYKQGYLTSPLKDTAGVSGHVIKLLTHKPYYKKLSGLAKIQARNFTWQQAADKFYKSLTFDTG